MGLFNILRGRWSSYDLSHVSSSSSTLSQNTGCATRGGNALKRALKSPEDHRLSRWESDTLGQTIKKSLVELSDRVCFFFSFTKSDYASTGNPSDVEKEIGGFVKDMRFDEEVRGAAERRRGENVQYLPQPETFCHQYGYGVDSALHSMEVFCDPESSARDRYLHASKLNRIGSFGETKSDFSPNNSFSRQVKATLHGVVNASYEEGIRASVYGGRAILAKVGKEVQSGLNSAPWSRNYIGDDARPFAAVKEELQKNAKKAGIDLISMRDLKFTCEATYCTPKEDASGKLVERCTLDVRCTGVKQRSHFLKEEVSFSMKVDVGLEFGVDGSSQNRRISATSATEVQQIEYEREFKMRPVFSSFFRKDMGSVKLTSRNAKILEKKEEHIASLKSLLGNIHHQEQQLQNGPLDVSRSLSGAKGELSAILKRIEAVSLPVKASDWKALSQKADEAMVNARRLLQEPRVLKTVEDLRDLLFRLNLKKGVLLRSKSHLGMLPSSIGQSARGRAAELLNKKTDALIRDFDKSHEAASKVLGSLEEFLSGSKRHNEIGLRTASVNAATALENAELLIRKLDCIDTLKSTRSALDIHRRLLLGKQVGEEFQGAIKHVVNKCDEAIDKLSAALLEMEGLPYPCNTRDWEATLRLASDAVAAAGSAVDARTGLVESGDYMRAANRHELLENPDDGLRHAKHYS